MAILNRRNAFVGWIVVKATKSVVKQKAADSVPSARTGGAAAGIVAGITGALLVRRRKRGDDGATE
jgi:hypothetical protein